LPLVWFFPIIMFSKVLEHMQPFKWLSMIITTSHPLYVW
jgi:hypothetical protein